MPSAAPPLTVDTRLGRSLALHARIRDFTLPLEGEAPAEPGSIIRYT